MSEMFVAATILDLLVFQRKRAMKIYYYSQFKRMYSKCTYVIPSGWHITRCITIFIASNGFGEVPVCVQRVLENDRDKFYIKEKS